jgi:hypothetical protein
VLDVVDSKREERCALKVIRSVKRYLEAAYVYPSCSLFLFFLPHRPAARLLLLSHWLLVCCSLLPLAVFPLVGSYAVSPLADSLVLRSHWLLSGLRRYVEVNILERIRKADKHKESLCVRLWTRFEFTHKGYLFFEFSCGRGSSSGSQTAHLVGK